MELSVKINVNGGMMMISCHNAIVLKGVEYYTIIPLTIAISIQASFKSQSFNLYVVLILIASVIVG